MLDNLFKGSFRTRLLGVSLILAAVGTAGKALLDNDPSTVVEWKTTGLALAAGWGFIVTRDDKVSSEQAGAK